MIKAADGFLNFNPRSYKRSDDAAPEEKQMWRNISIHAPTRGATWNGRPVLTMEDQFQSTLLQEERPYNFYPFRCYIKISIHAPTRGATTNEQKAGKMK